MSVAAVEIIDAEFTNGEHKINYLVEDAFSLKCTENMSNFLN
jgi:hypothetical protein